MHVTCDTWVDCTGICGWPSRWNRHTVQQASLEGICKRQARPAISGLPTFDMCTHCPSYLLPRMASKQGLLPYMAHMLEPHSRHDQPCTGLAANPHAMHSMPCTACVSVHLPSCGVFVVLHHDVASTPDAVPILSCCMIMQPFFPCCMHASPERVPHAFVLQI